MRKESELEFVSWPGGSRFKLGESASCIVLITDGIGPTGYYDRIHVYNDTGHHIFPAHHAEGWTVKKDV